MSDKKKTPPEKEPVSVDSLVKKHFANDPVGMDTCRYHKTEKPRIFKNATPELLEDLEKIGWVDTPAKFKK